MSGMGRTIVRNHLVAITVVCRDKRNTALALDGVEHPRNARVNGLDGRNGGRHDAGMADHVGVREVHDVDVRLVVVDGVRKRLRNGRLAHFGLQVVRGNFRTGNETALLAHFRLFPTAVKEERDMGVHFSFGDVVLA